jgi:hypothetical protein
VIDVNSGKISLGVVVKYDPCGNLPALDARFLREVDVERIGIWKIVELDGRNPRRLGYFPRPERTLRCANWRVFGLAPVAFWKTSNAA